MYLSKVWVCVRVCVSVRLIFQEGNVTEKEKEKL